MCFLSPSPSFSLDDLQTAVEHMETFHELTSINNWHTESGENLYRISCEHLRRIYTSIAEKVKREGEREKERGRGKERRRGR